VYTHVFEEFSEAVETVVLAARRQVARVDLRRERRERQQRARRHQQVSHGAARASGHFSYSLLLFLCKITQSKTAHLHLLPFLPFVSIRINAISQHLARAAQKAQAPQPKFRSQFSFFPPAKEFL